MTPIRIAAVIPAFNAAASIRGAIASAQGQSHPPDEIIVVDDGSADDTAAVATAAGARVIRQANAGPAAARNAGIASTSAEWIALLDADDSWRPERLARQLPLLGEDRVAVVYSGHHVAGKHPPIPPASLDFDDLWERNAIPTSTVLLRRAAWETIGGFDPARELIGVEDYNLWLRLAHAGWRLRGVQERLVDYQPTAASLTRQTRRFARAELTQLSRVAATLGLDPGRVREKEFKMFLEYGLELFYFRDLIAAREYLQEAARRAPLPAAARMKLWASYLSRPGRRAD